MQIWSTLTGTLLKSCRGHDAEITDFAVSCDNSMLASGDVAHCIRVWSLQVRDAGVDWRAGGKCGQLGAARQRTFQSVGNGRSRYPRRLDPGNFSMHTHVRISLDKQDKGTLLWYCCANTHCTAHSRQL